MYLGYTKREVLSEVLPGIYCSRTKWKVLRFSLGSTWDILLHDEVEGMEVLGEVLPRIYFSMTKREVLRFSMRFYLGYTAQ